MRIPAILLLASAAGGCTTVSFAPPEVDTEHDVAAIPQSTCAPAFFHKNGARVQIGRDVEGALAMTNNFVLSYRCAIQEVANGRQVFEIPSFLAAATGLVGSQVGLNADAILVAGTAASVLGSAQSYWAPAEKRPLVDAALGALLCIKTEQVGIGHFDTTRPEQPQEELIRINSMIETVRNERAAAVHAVSLAGTEEEKDLAEASTERLDREMATLQHLRASAVERWLTAEIASGEIGVPAQRQYYEMVTASLFSVERILGGRLAGAGTPDSEALLARLKETVAAASTAEASATRQEDVVAKVLSGQQQSLIGPAAERAKLVRLRNEELQTKLQICVQQAHL